MGPLFYAQEKPPWLACRYESKTKILFKIRSLRSNLSKPKGSTLVDEQVRDIVLATICTHVFG